MRGPVSGLVLLALALASGPHESAAHPLAPALLEVRELGEGRVEVTWKTSPLQPRGVRLAPILPPSCHPLGSPVTATEGVGVRTRWTAACAPEGLTGARFGVDGLESPVVAVVRVLLADGRRVEGIVSAGTPFLDVPARPGPGAVARGYLALGIEHIATGPDHLLFVFGLVLLAGTAGRLLGTATAFTVGHSVTLSLAALGLVRLPPRPIELAIAVSVLVLAIELARGPDARTVLGRHPWAMAFGFGLLHGLGFAAALVEAGLPPADVPLALLAFNAGIEVGQLTFVALVLALRGALGAVRLRPAGWMRRMPVYAMGSVAAFWCFVRAADLLR